MTATLTENAITDNQNLVDGLIRYARFEDLRRSEFYREHQARIRQLLEEPQIFQFPDARPRLQSFLRVVEWNIERGARLEGIIETLNTHPVLRFADLLLLNELDDGMIRSRNLNIALELSHSLEAHAVFGAEYLELTKGAGFEAALPGQNTRALHGNAILTRHAFENIEVIRLPRCENNFESKERRIGSRIGILLDLAINDRTVVVGNTHLDVVNSPRCRGKQMRAMLQTVDNRLSSRSIKQAIVGGDLNTHTFARGTRFRSMKNTALILTSKRENLIRRLRHPETSEPAIREFAKFGFVFEGFNDQRATSRTIVSNLDDSARLPRAMKWWVSRRIPAQGLTLEFRLDWLAARGLVALKAGEIVDEHTGVASVGAQTLSNLTHQGSPLSDHDPVVFDVAIPRSGPV